MTKNSSQRVVFYQVNQDQMKKKRIIQTAKEYFEKRQPLLFKLPHQKAIEYLDLLLWRLPQDGFIPHIIKDSPCNDTIVLTTTDENPNQARSVFNLTNHPIKNSFFTRIYCFEDTASTEKNHISQEHYRAYKTLGCTIISL